MPEIIDKDIFLVTRGVICHSCNCMGVMGAGMALKVKKKFPHVFNAYQRACRNGSFTLGKIQILPAGFGSVLYICNMATQYHYGRNKRYVDYDAFRSCIKKVSEWAISRNLQLFLPFKISSTLAGGDWDVVLQIIAEEAPSSIICKFEEYNQTKPLHIKN